MMKKLFSRSNLIALALFLLLLIVAVNPGAKAFLIKGLMKVGFFQAPDKSENTGSERLPVAPTLSFRSADGNLINLAELKGKVVYLNFWAPWCPPCIAEMGSVNEFYNKYKASTGVVILTVDVDSDFSKSVPFMQKRGYGLPVYSLASAVPEGLLSGSIPTTLIVDKKGRIVVHHEGAADYSERGFYDYVDGLIRE